MRISVEREPVKAAITRHMQRTSISHEVYEALHKQEYEARINVLRASRGEGSAGDIEIARELHEYAENNKIRANGRYIMPGERPWRRVELRIALGAVNVRIPLPPVRIHSARTKIPN